MTESDEQKRFEEQIELCRECAWKAGVRFEDGIDATEPGCECCNEPQRAVRRYALRTVVAALVRSRPF